MMPTSNMPKKIATLPNTACPDRRSEEHTSELQSRFDLVCRLLLEKKKPETYFFPLELLADVARSLGTGGEAENLLVQGDLHLRVVVIDLGTGRGQLVVVHARCPLL